VYVKPPQDAADNVVLPQKILDFTHTGWHEKKRAMASVSQTWC